MNNIAICIPTYKRASMLENLISSISACDFDQALIKNVNIIVVDNDAERTADATIQALIQNPDQKFNLAYFNYPVKGLSNVRNELLRRAFELTPDFIVFIDDDEYVTKLWLNELVRSITVNNADCARGPVLAVNGETVPPQISYCFKRESYPDGMLLSRLTTGNLIMRRSSLEKYNVWFDARFNLSGSEDGYFGVEILKQGAKICWAEKAVTYEVIPESRANIAWLIKRTYRTTCTYSLFLILESKYILVVKKILVSFLYLAMGCLASVTLLTNSRKKYWGPLKIAEGLGGLGGFMNITYQEYKNI